MARNINLTLFTIFKITFFFYLFNFSYASVSNFNSVNNLYNSSSSHNTTSNFIDSNTSPTAYTNNQTSFINSNLVYIYNMLKAEPSNVTLLNAYGIELAKMGDLISAIKVWRYAIDINPNYVHLYNNIGSALRRLGYKKEARQWYQASLRVQPTYWTWYNLGLLEEDENNYQEAINAYTRSLEIFPGFSEANERLLFLQQSKLPQNIYQTIKKNNNDLNKTEDENKIISSSKIKQDNKTLKENKENPIEINKFDNNKLSKLKSQTNELEHANKNSKANFQNKNIENNNIPVTKKINTKSNETILTLSTPYDKGGQVFITFDGGADADGATLILDELAKRNVKATFFLTGEWVIRYPEIAKRIIKEGHEIANHSMRHKNMANWTSNQIKRELEEAEEVFIRVLGRRGAPFFRFPFGAQNPRVEKIVEEQGYRPVYWHIDTLDWQEPPVQTIVNKVTSKVKRGAVILMHLGSKNGAKALPQILDILISQGYKPDKLSNFNPNLLVSLPTISNHKLNF